MVYIVMCRLGASSPWVISRVYSNELAAKAYIIEKKMTAHKGLEYKIQLEVIFTGE